MSNLNGESLHDWIRSERKAAQTDYYQALRDEDGHGAAYCQGIMDILHILRQKLISRQVNPYGDRNPLSD